MFSEKILTIHIEPNLGLRDYQVRQLGFGLGLSADQIKKFVPFVQGLFRLFIEKDASQVEINPLVITGGDDVIALDGKINFDDNALYRHEDIAALRDPDEEDSREPCRRVRRGCGSGPDRCRNGPRSDT